VFSSFSSLYVLVSKHIFGLFEIGVLSTILFIVLWGVSTLFEILFFGFTRHLKKKAYKLAILLFIFSEVIFFFGFFWRFFESSLSPNLDIGILWPRFSIFSLNPFLIPFLNTLILLTSGVFVTISHYLILFNKKIARYYLFFTVVLGLYFSLIQLTEYKNLHFRICDSVFGCNFFLLTGFHGAHVIIGSLLLLFSLTRIVNFQLNKLNFLAFELRAWYWHFVDVVWLFLFVFVYWWSYV